MAQKIRGYIFTHFYLRVWRTFIPPVRKTDKKSTYYRKFFVILSARFDGGAPRSLERRIVAKMHIL